MEWSWTDLGISVILYAVIMVYDAKYEDFLHYFDTRLTRWQRRLFRNILGAAVLAADAATMLVLRRNGDAELWKTLLFFAAASLAALHILNSLAAIARLKKVYVAIDIVSYLIRFAGFAVLGIVQFFIMSSTKILFTLAAIYYMTRRGIRMLDGDWLESRLNDFD